MTRINLLPHREEKRKAKRQQFYGLLGLVSILACLIVFLVYTIIDGYIVAQEAKNDFLIRLAETAKLVIENDLPAVLDVNYATIEKTQKLLMIIAEHVPLQPTTEKLASSISSTRDSCLKMMYLLDKAAILRLLTTELKSYKRLVNPEKIYLDNTNLMYALGSNVNEGNLRETFLFNQVGNTHDVRSSHAGDFLIDGKLRVEVGGPSKDFSQIADIPDSFLAIDGIETGYGARIPLWLFGFLY